MQQMSEVQEVQQIPYQQSPTYAEKGGPGAQQAEINSLKKMMWLQMVLLGGLFITQVIIGIVLAAKVDDFVTRGTETADNADTWMAAMMESGNKLKETADIITDPAKAATLIGGTVSTMMLGNPDGSMAAYLQDMTENDYKGMASNMGTLSDYIRDNMKAASAGKNCDAASVYLSCPDQTYPSSPHVCTSGATGETRYCNCWGSVDYDTSCSCYKCTGSYMLDCTPDKPKECVMEGISNVAAVVSSVMDKAKTLEKVTSENDIGNPAMSNGLLRLNWLANWTIAQGGPGGVQSYKTLSKQCKSLVANVLKVDWRGSFINAAGERKDWDVRESVDKVTEWVTMFCNALE